MQSLVTPSNTEFVAYVLVSIVVLVVFNTTQILNTILDPAAAELSYKIFGEQVRSIVMILDSFHWTAAGVLAAFWAAFGLLLFATGVTLIEIYRDTRLDLEEASSHLHHPKYFNKWQWIKYSLERIGVRCLGVIVLALATATTISFVLPVSVQLFGVITRILERPIFALFALTGIIFLTFTCHIFVVAMRMIVLRPKVEHDIIGP